jgi:hypothetical protein
MAGNVNTAAGSKLYVGTTAANQATDTYIEVGEVVSIGEFGRSYDSITYNALGDRNVKKFKGQRDDGMISLELGRAPNDAGQAAMLSALDADFDYNFKVTLNDEITPPKASAVTITIAAPGVVSWTAHGLTAGTPVVFSTTGALPTGLVAGTTYYVIAAGLVTNAFEVSATLGGSAITTSGSQSGVHTAVATPGNPTTFTMKGKVMSYTTNVSSSNNIVSARASIGLTSGSIIETSAS